ncbi:unnamed protein product [Parnassius mnemosyne]|uniref:Uncharacterized protein n=1 Tax=Parnassius mnemosyne TaxID=213953 RepID=A0AAV1KLZ5_9NEOP
MVYLYQICSDTQSVTASHICNKMKFLAIFAVLAVASAAVVGRDKRSFGLVSPAVYTTNEQYVVSSPVYRAVSSPVVYNAYRTQPVNYVSYPTTYTAAVPQVYSSPVVHTVSNDPWC